MRMQNTRPQSRLAQTAHLHIIDDKGAHAGRSATTGSSLAAGARMPNAECRMPNAERHQLEILGDGAFSNLIGGRRCLGRSASL